VDGGSTIFRFREHRRRRRRQPGEQVAGDLRRCGIDQHLVIKTVIGVFVVENRLVVAAVQHGGARRPGNRERHNRQPSKTGGDHPQYLHNPWVETWPPGAHRPILPC
jgi:hypothetical protein